MMDLEQFLRSGLRNAWLAPHPKMSVYVRRSVRFDEGRMIKCLDIASVGVAEDSQRQGIFSRFLKTFERAAFDYGFEGVFVESIMNDNLYHFLIRRGYVVARGAGDDLIYRITIADSAVKAA